MSKIDTQNRHELEAAVAAAYAEIARLEQHRDGWHISIPVQPTDSDVLLSEALAAQSREISRLTLALFDSNQASKLNSFAAAAALERAEAAEAARDALLKELEDTLPVFEKYGFEHTGEYVRALLAQYRPAGKGRGQ